MAHLKRITKCSHCDYIDFLDKMSIPSRCPGCGASIKQIKNPFETESIKVKHLTMDGKTVKLTITFHQCADRARIIVVNSLNKVIPNESLKNRVSYTLQIYAWILLKKAPQLWHDMDFLINSIREILTLRLNK